MKRQSLMLFAILAGMTLFFSACDKSASPFSQESIIKEDFSAPVALPTGWTCGDKLTIPLLAGKWTTVGNVEVTSDEVNMYVKYLIDDAAKWAISETHLSVTTSLDAVPGYPGNPKIGNFNYNDEHPNVAEVSYTVPLSDFDGAKDFYILAHAVVENLGEPVSSTPEPIILPTEDILTKITFPNSTSYFATIITEDEALNGTFDGWCIDMNTTIVPQTEYWTTVVSGLAPESELTFIEKPENMFRINWLLNEDFAGKMATDDLPFTWQDVQMTIWTLLENELKDPGFAYSENHVNQLVEMAMGVTSYIPECGQAFAVILRPKHPATGEYTIQPYIIKQYVNCTYTYGDETAWAAGNAFTGDSWAMYFEYCVE